MRPRRALFAVAALALLLSGCGRARPLNQGQVRDAVRSALTAEGELTDDQVGDAADCVARGLFEGDFTKEERDDVTFSNDGDEPSTELTARVVALVDGCKADALAGTSSDETSTTGEETTTTEQG